MELVNNVHAHNLVAWAKDKPEVVVFSGDLTGSTEISLFRDTYPERFFSLGMAEQNMLSWAGGMAREGFTPFLHTFAVFLYRRPFDQLSMSIAYPNLRVRLFGFLPGISTPGGVTHQAIEDVSVLRGVPNMTIFEMGDATDVESVLDVSQAVNGPVYIRMLRGQIPRLFPRNEPMQFNRARVLSEGDDFTLISSGICTEEAMRATLVLREKGVSIQHLHVSTLKPFTDSTVVEAIAKSKMGVITMENHSVIGGVGTAVSEVMAELGAGIPLIRIGIPDTYAHGATRQYLMKKYQLDAISFVRQAEKLLNTTFDIEEADLAAVRLQTPSSAGADQLEAL
ncbi:MAG: transketolase [Chloroflexi bacterium]|nr:MAG: transketolase [Chloroflexota bacterium]